MQKLLDNNDILLYSTHNEGKPIVDERFIRTLKAVTYKKSYLSYLNKSVDEYDNTYDRYIGKKLVKILRMLIILL